MIKYTKDGRTILTGEDMRLLRNKKAKAADYECEWCATPAPLQGFNQGQLHHMHGRGFGGGKRNDTVESCVWICSNCHESEHRPEAIQ